MYMAKDIFCTPPKSNAMEVEAGERYSEKTFIFNQSIRLQIYTTGKLSGGGDRKLPIVYYSGVMVILPVESSTETTQLDSGASCIRLCLQSSGLSISPWIISVSNDIQRAINKS